MKVYIETYGCQMNEYDTELAVSLLEMHGYEVISVPEEADIALLNTCSVRENANRKVLARVHDLRHKANNGDLVIGILGCMATDYQEKLIDNKRLPINFIAGPDSYRRLPELINQCLHFQNRLMDVTLSKTETYDGVVPVRTSGVNAWIAVMRGCNNFCSFCVVPYTRGRERSRSVQSVVDETRRIVRDGYPQVTLLGQNVNSYRHEDHDFAGLLEAVSAVDGIERIRFTSPHPKDFPDPLIRVMADHPKICKHIHLPLQAGNSRILELMRRTYTKEDYLRLVDKIRSHIPDVVLSTDIIVGFPTETDQEFKDTVDVVNKVRFDSAFIFKYSERDGTLAQKHFTDDVPEEVKTERIVTLNELQKSISLHKNRAHIGQVHDVLIEADSTKKSDKDIQGRNDGNKLVILPKKHHNIGDFVRAKITDASAHVLRGVVKNSDETRL